MMITYVASNVVPLSASRPVLVHPDFVPLVDVMNAAAKRLGLVYHVTNSFRLPSAVLRGTVVPPARMSNHLVAHALDGNLSAKSIWYDSKKIRTECDRRIGAVYSFVCECRAQGLRWGGDFPTPDVVHFDSGLNVTNPVRWHEIFASL